MDRSFHSLRPDMKMLEACDEFNRASAKERQRVIGMVVTDDQGRLVGMLSMYDILPLIRGHKTHDWQKMDDAEVMRLIDNSCGRIKSVRVADIMTRKVITVGPEVHAMEILDIMLRRHIRRLPVLDEGKIVGMVYISAVFNYFSDRVRTCPAP